MRSEDELTAIKDKLADVLLKWPYCKWVFRLDVGDDCIVGYLTGMPPPEFEKQIDEIIVKIAGDEDIVKWKSAVFRIKLKEWK